MYIEYTIYTLLIYALVFFFVGAGEFYTGTYKDEHNERIYETNTKKKKTLSIIRAHRNVVRLACARPTTTTSPLAMQTT